MGDRRDDTPTDMHGVPWTPKDKSLAMSNRPDATRWPLDDVVEEDGMWRLVTHTRDQRQFTVRADLAHHVRRP